MLLYIKAIHIIFVVSWFAGLFYIVRLFIYHTEAEEKQDVERKILQNQFKIMESRLWKIITVPSMILTIASGIYMLWLMPVYLEQGWMVVKLILVAGLLVYHFGCGRILKNLKNNVINISTGALRMWNEVATLFLVAITFIVVLKDSLNWIWAVTGLILLGVALMLAIKLYKRLRQ